MASLRRGLEILLGIFEKESIETGPPETLCR
jgi:hypothetical protein